MTGHRLPSVQALTEVRRIPWRVKRRLRRQRRRGATGILLYADIREPVRSPVYKLGIVVLRKDGAELCNASRSGRRLRWVELKPGKHEVEFMVIRLSEAKRSE